MVCKPVTERFYEWGDFAGIVCTTSSDTVSPWIHMIDAVATNLRQGPVLIIGICCKSVFVFKIIGATQLCMKVVLDSLLLML